MRTLLVAVLALPLAGCLSIPGKILPSVPEEEQVISLPKPLVVVMGNSYDCGAEALYSIFNYYERPVELKTLQEELYVPGVDGTFPQKLTQVAKQHDFAARTVDGSIPALREAIRKGIPSIIMIRVRDQANHYLIPTGYHPEKGWFVCEFYKGYKWILTEQELEKAWKPCGFTQLEFTPDSSMANRTRARSLEENGDFKEALTAYRALLAKNPNDIPARIGVGNCLAMNGDYVEARKEYTLALDAGSKDPELFNNLADVCLQLGEKDARTRGWAEEAVSNYTRQLNSPETTGLRKTIVTQKLALALGTLGSICAAREEISEARKYFQQSLELLGPNDTELRNRRLEQIDNCDKKLK